MGRIPTKFDIILLLIPFFDLTWASDSDQHYTFYFLEGNYYVTSDSSASSQGCNYVPETPLGDRQSSVMEGDKCVILYAQADCRGGALVAPPGFDWSFVLDEVSSFHPCNLDKPFQPGKPTPRPHKPGRTQLILFDGTTSKDQLVEYRNLQSCENLPEEAVNKVTSVELHGDCALLYDEEGCKGDMQKVTSTSLYHSDLAKLNFDDKILSVSGCEPLANDNVGRKERNQDSSSMKNSSGKITLLPILLMLLANYCFSFSSAASHNL